MPRKAILMNRDEVGRAKAWGEAHGYYWMMGGYVYKEGETRLNRQGLPRSVCRGWGALYKKIGRAIDQWCKEQDLEVKDAQTKHE